MLLKKKIAINAVLRLLGKLGSLAMSLFTIGILTRYLGPDKFGYYMIVMTFLQIFSTFSDLGLPAILTRRISQENANQEMEVSSLLTLQAIIGALFFSFAPLIALLFPYEQIIPVAIAITAISGWTGLLQTALIGVFERHVATWKLGVAELIGRVLTLAGTLVAAILGGGFLAFIAVFTLSGIGQFGLTLIMARQHVKFRPQFNYKVWISALREAWPLAIMSMITLLYVRGDILLLSVTRSTAEAGLYGAAYKILNVTSSVPPIFLGLIFPLLALEWSRKNLIGLRRKMSLSLDFLALAVLPIAFGALAMSSDLMLFVGGNEFISAGPILTIFMIGAIAIFWRSLYSCMILAAGLQKQLVKYHACNAVLTILLYLFFIPKYGTLAAAAITIFSECFTAVIVTIIITPVINFQPNFKRLAIILLASGLMYILLITTKELSIFFRLSIGIISYLIFIFSLRGLPLKELKEVLRLAVNK
jgi:O-antigen/teichoic acid export membrane protein